MKTIIKLTFLLFTLSNGLFGQNSDQLTISVYESGDKGYNKIVVLDDDKKLEEFELTPFYYKDIESHQVAINTLLSKYKKAGYKIISELRGTVGGGNIAQIIVMVTTYRLEKK